MSLESSSISPTLLAPYGFSIEPVFSVMATAHWESVSTDREAGLKLTMAAARADSLKARTSPESSARGVVMPWSGASQLLAIRRAEFCCPAFPCSYIR